MEPFNRAIKAKIQFKTLVKPRAGEHRLFSILCPCPEASRDKCLTTKLYSINEVSSAVASESYYLSWFGLISCSMHINGWEMERYSQLKNKTCSKQLLAALRIQDITHSANCYHRAPGRTPLLSLPKSPWFLFRDRVSLTCTAFRCHYSSNYGAFFSEELPEFQKTFMSSCPVTGARVRVADGECVLISGALKLALWTCAGLSLMVTTALGIRS